MRKEYITSEQNENAATTALVSNFIRARYGIYDAIPRVQVKMGGAHIMRGTHNAAEAVATSRVPYIFLDLVFYTSRAQRLSVSTLIVDRLVHLLFSRILYMSQIFDTFTNIYT